jgi:hypothetical protein
VVTCQNKEGKIMRHWKPLFVENSRIPVLFSYIAPIEINAITLGIVVFSRSTMDERTRQHETIHFQQFLETGFIGFLIIYIWDFIVACSYFQDAEIAYTLIRAEKEAYLHDSTPLYLEERIRWDWLKVGKDDEEIT